MKKLISLLALLSAFVAPSAFAAAQWNGPYTPTQIQTQLSSGDVIFYSATVGGCTYSDFWIIKSTSNAKTSLSVLLTATALGRQVYVFTQASGYCDGTGRPMYTDIKLAD